MTATSREQIPDQDVINRILNQGNIDSYEILYDKYVDKVYAKCLLILKNKELAYSTTQLILSEAFGSLSSQPPGLSFSRWLVQITKKHCISQLSSNASSS